MESLYNLLRIVHGNYQTYPVMKAVVLLVMAPMSKDIIAQKRKINFTWNTLSWEEASTLANFCKNKGVVVMLTYPDIMTGGYMTGRFYTGDMSANYKLWCENRHIVTNVTCNFIEM